MTFIYKIAAILIFGVGSAHAAPSLSANAGTLTFSDGNEYIVVDSAGVQVCNHLDTVYTCTVSRGKYRWRDLTDAETGYFTSLKGGVTNDAPTEHPEPNPPSSGLFAGTGGASSAEIQAAVDALTILTEAEVEAIARSVFTVDCELVPE